ncbi:oligosaccharide repeat unit polymerase [Methanocaldococcus indicus]|uniref:oligosaccharide repeat unit polymerase n=1 Tax=Methanocaldococcus indicus TaxID=213231 RepID=UPI003C6CD929
MSICNLKEQIKKIEFFKPYNIVIFGHLAIFLLAIPYYHKLGFINIVKMLIIISIFIFFFYLPHKYNFKIEKNKIFIYIISTILFVLSFYGAFYSTNSLILSFVYSVFLFVVIYLYKNLKDSEIFTNFMFFLGFTSFIILINKYGGIPLFDYSIRMAINTEPLRLIAMGGLIYGSLNNKFRAVVSFMLLVLLGYKIGVLLLVFSYIYYNYKNNLRVIFISLILLFIVMNIMGYIIIKVSPQMWKISPIEFLSYRAYFDLYVFSKIINSNIITLGKILFTPNGERFVGELLYNYKANLTTTMFGTVYLDFNIFGVVLAFIIGYLSKILYYGDKKIYAIYASLLLAYCDIGINFGFLVTLFLMVLASTIVKEDKIWKD